MKMICPLILWLFLGLTAPLATAQDEPRLLEKRAGHKTQLLGKKREQEAAPKPPADAPFELVKFPTKLGGMSAYLTKPAGGEKGKRPAIVWITGGFPTASPGAYLWEPTKIGNEQSARIYRLEGITTMFPTVRGSEPGNPGYQEGFYGEVEDIISAGDYLSKLPQVDPQRIYLGGHSTGGTLALLVAESTDRFAGVFCFGPTDEGYGKETAPHKWDKKERGLRSPIQHLGSIRVPTYVIEGEGGNRESLVALEEVSKNKNVRFILADRADHFDVIHPANAIIAKAIMASRGGELELDLDKLRSAYTAQAQRHRETRDLELLAKLRDRGVDFDAPRKLSFYLFAREVEAFTDAVGRQAATAGFTHTDPEKFAGSGDTPYYAIVLTKKIDLARLKQLFAATAAVEALAAEYDLQYDDWTVD